MNFHNMTSAMRRLITAREKVASRNEWFGGIIYSARLEERKIGTMATDGIDVFFDSSFVADNDPFIEGVFLHEILHCALDHPARRKWREKALFNIACDYAINPLVKRYFPLPKDALIDDRFDGMRAEAIYEILDQERKGKGKPQGQPVPNSEQGDNDQSSPSDGEQEPEGDSGGDSPTEDEGNGKQPEQKSGEMLDPPSPEELEKARERWRDAVSKATEKCEKAGNMPSVISTILKDLLPSEKLDWRKVLDDWARNSRDNTSLTWRRPNRRSIASGNYRPGYEQTKIHKLVACIDCSGSIDDAWVKEMKAELVSLLEQRLVTSVHLIATDTRIVNEAEVSTPEDIEAFKGGRGGGTQFDDAMFRVAEIDDAMGCVFLTDMATMSFGHDPGMDVVWVDWTGNGNQKVPFGKVCAL